jgi:hypothetical protein
MRAIFINTEKQEVTEFQFTGDISEITDKLNCEMFTTVRYDNSHDTLFVDDMGLYTDKPMFTIGRYHQPLKGNGVIIGADREGESVSTQSSAEEIKALVSFEGSAPFELKFMFAMISRGGHHD